MVQHEGASIPVTDFRTRGRSDLSACAKNVSDDILKVSTRVQRDMHSAILQPAEAKGGAPPMTAVHPDDVGSDRGLETAGHIFSEKRRIGMTAAT